MNDLFKKKNLIESGKLLLVAIIAAWGVPKLLETLRGDGPKPKTIFGPLGITATGVVGIMSGNKLILPLAVVAAGTGAVETLRYVTTDENGLAKEGKFAQTVNKVLPGSAIGLGDIPDFQFDAADFPDLDQMQVTAQAGSQAVFA